MERSKIIHGRKETKELIQPSAVWTKNIKWELNGLQITIWLFQKVLFTQNIHGTRSSRHTLQLHKPHKIYGHFKHKQYKHVSVQEIVKCS